MAEASTLADLLTEARGYLDTRAYDSTERATFRALVDALASIHDGSGSLGQRLQAATVTIPLRVGFDGELLDANGNCQIVVDPNREMSDEHVEVIGKAICAAVNLCGGLPA